MSLDTDLSPLGQRQRIGQLFQENDSISFASSSLGHVGHLAIEPEWYDVI